MAVNDVMLFKIFDWTMASIIAFDWLWKNPRHVSNPRHASNLLHRYGVCCNSIYTHGMSTIIYMCFYPQTHFINFHHWQISHIRITHILVTLVVRPYTQQFRHELTWCHMLYCVVCVVKYNDATTIICTPMSTYMHTHFTK